MQHIFVNYKIKDFKEIVIRIELVNKQKKSVRSVPHYTTLCWVYSPYGQIGTAKSAAEFKN